MRTEWTRGGDDAETKNPSFSSFIPEHPNHLEDPLLVAMSLRPKCYITVSLNDVTKKAKGVIKSCLKNQINVDHYYQCLKTNRSSEFIQRKFVSKRQKLYLESFKKICLSTLDFKRFWLADGIHSVPFYLPERLWPKFYPSESNNEAFSFPSVMSNLDKILKKISLLNPPTTTTDTTITTTNDDEHDSPRPVLPTENPRLERHDATTEDPRLELTEEVVDDSRNGGSARDRNDDRVVSIATIPFKKRLLERFQNEPS